MKKSIRIITLFLALIAFALMAMGSGSSSSNDKKSTPEPAAVSTKSTPQPSNTPETAAPVNADSSANYSLSLKIRSDDNLMFSTYDITISLDSTEIGSVANGKTFEYSANISGGEHTLDFCKSGASSPKCSKTIVITEDTAYSCLLKHGSSSIEITNEKAEKKTDTKPSQSSDIPTTADSTAESQTAPSIDPNASYQLLLIIHSEDNLFFSTYDIAISVDGKELGTVANGETFSDSIDVSGGEHTLVFNKSGDAGLKSERTITVSESTTYYCDLKHESDTISIRNESIETVANSSFEVPDVTGITLEEAENKLKSIGFINISAEPADEIEVHKNWLVSSQSVAAGSTLIKYENITLECIHLDEYFQNIYKGKNINEVLELASQYGHSLEYHTLEWEDLSSQIPSMDSETKNNWIVLNAFQNSATEASLIMTYIGETVPETTPTPTTPAPVKKNTAKYHSSGDRDIAKKGNTGVYAYEIEDGLGLSYYIIDFDEGYVYSFHDRDSSICDRYKIDSGDLNTSLVFTVHEGDQVWQEKLYFKWANMPDTLININGRGQDCKFTTTNLADALARRDKKTISDK
ncbi:MAG: PASTA domain-containing protein [Lachnospiraceae bacterium]|nr:PASTA domain-containing protein [Lachnospiraceae bacterium]